MAHDITYSSTGHNAYTYRCRCGDVCEPQQTQQMAEDQAKKHLDIVARIRKPRSCTLEVEYAHALTMSKNPEVSDADRDLWVKMARELGKRLGYEAPPSKQEELFTL